MCQRLLCSEPQRGSWGDPLLYIPTPILSMFHFCLRHIGGGRKKKTKTLPSCRIFELMKPTLTGREHANPLLSWAGWRLTVVHSCPACVHMLRPLGGPVEGMISSWGTVLSPVWRTENGFSRVWGHAQKRRDRERDWNGNREGVKKRSQKGGEKGEKKTTCMCLVSGPSYIKQTQINRSAIAFSKRTADRPINEG